MRVGVRVLTLLSLLKVDLLFALFFIIFNYFCFVYMFVCLLLLFSLFFSLFFFWVYAGFCFIL